MNGAKILIVEDDPIIRAMLEECMGDLGYVVAIAADGQVGLELALARPPDLVLLDLMLPRLDGIALTRQLRSDPRTENVAIVAMSAVPDRATIRECRRAGCDDFLAKPFDLDLLEERVGICLTSHRTPREERAW